MDSADLTARPRAPSFEQAFIARRDARARLRARTPYRHGLKRVLDVVVVVIASPAVLLTVLLLALLVALDGGRPFFVQERLGRGGRIYRMWKLRSMVPDAEARLERHLEADAAARVEWDHHQKLRRDPRITPLGALLRKTSLDELPQLWNVVRGEMSLVGPRPPLPSEVEQYEDDMLRRLNVLPGMTGLWQVSGRSDLSWEDTVRLDLYYVDNWSMVQDLLILARTVTAVLASRGAY